MFRSWALFGVGPMVVFEGAVILALGGRTSRAGDGSRVAGAGRVVGLPEGGVALAVRPPGFPVTLPLDAGDAAAGPLSGGARAELEGARGVVAVLQPLGGADAVAGAAVPLARLGEGLLADGCEVAALAWMPPVDVADLVSCRPLGGQRTHVGVRGAPTTVCGRLPLQGPAGSLGKVDCLRCLRSHVVADRLGAQLGYHGGLVALAGPLVAGVAARLWLRLGHRNPRELPALLDAMVGAIVFGVPGAPEVEATLATVHRYRQVASPPVRRWAQGHARRRLSWALRHVLPQRPQRLPEALDEELRVARDLLPTAEAAEVLVAALEEHGPAVAIEPIALQAAVNAGQAASPRVRRWREIHEVAGALSGLPGLSDPTHRRGGVHR